MTSSARTRSAAVLVLQAACLAAWLTGCAAQPDMHFFDPQETSILEQPLSVIQPCVPRALDALGVTVMKQDQGKGKLTFHASSASDLEVEVKLEAMTTKQTQVAVWVYGHSSFGDWLASEIAAAINDEVDKATESAAPAGG